MADQKITDALSALDADDAALTKSKADADEAGTQLAAAQHQVDVTTADVAAKKDQLLADKAALIKLIDTTYVA